MFLDRHILLILGVLSFNLEVPLGCGEEEGNAYTIHLVLSTEMITKIGHREDSGSISKLQALASFQNEPTTDGLTVETLALGTLYRD